jgi:hypothetical protein
LTCGEWLSFGGPDMPADQASTLAVGSTAFYTKTLDRDLDIFGHPSVECDVTVENDDWYKNESFLA